MRLPRVGFTVRRLMVAAAAVAVACGAEVARRRGSPLAEEYRSRASLYRRLAPGFDGMASDRGVDRETAERWRRAAVYYGMLLRKYERAARYPWLPVEPDPPRPD